MEQNNLIQKNTHHLHSSFSAKKIQPESKSKRNNLTNTKYRTFLVFVLQKCQSHEERRECFRINRTKNTWQLHIKHDPWLNIFAHFSFALCLLLSSETGSFSTGWLQLHYVAKAHLPWTGLRLVYIPLYLDQWFSVVFIQETYRYIWKPHVVHLRISLIHAIWIP